MSLAGISVQKSATPAAMEVGTSLWKDAWTRLKKNKLAVIGAAILSLLIIVSILTPWIVPYSYEEQDLALGSVGPSWQHWFGTDSLGRDLFTRVLYGLD